MPRTDAERLDLLVDLIGFGRTRGEVLIFWGPSGLHLAAGPAGERAQEHASDADGDVLALLDRAISKIGGTKKRPRRKRA